MDRKITIAIPYYNRSDLIHDTLQNVINDDRVSEIVINDDCSNDSDFASLNDYINKLNNPKVLVFRNSNNVGSFFNKLETIKKCKNEWVFLLDSDNYLYQDSLDKLYDLKWNSEVAYYPAGLFANGNREPYNRCHGNWAHDRFCGDKEFDFLEASDMFIEQPGFDGLLNAGNLFVNRDKYIDVCNKYAEEMKSFNFTPHASDGIFFNYLWLINSNKLKVVKDLNYFHRMHGGSTWGKTAEQSKVISNRLTYLLKNKIKINDIKEF